MMYSDGNRLLLQFDKVLRQINREHINDAVKGISIQDLKGIAELVARARAAYLQCMFELGQKYRDEGDPNEVEVGHLRELRVRFDELLKASGEFETVIKRGYLDINTTA